MTWRRIIAYYALAGVLGAYFFAYVYEPRHDPLTVPEPTVSGRGFLPLERGEIRAMTLSRSDEPDLRFRLQQGRWEAVDPVGAGVTPDVVESFIENLTPEKDLRLIDADPADVAVYGLDAPTSTIVVRGADGARETTVQIGSLNPASSAYYGQRTDAPEVVLLGYNVGYYADLMFQSARRTAVDDGNRTAPERSADAPR